MAIVFSSVLVRPMVAAFDPGTEPDTGSRHRRPNFSFPGGDVRLLLFGRDAAARPAVRAVLDPGVRGGRMRSPPRQVGPCPLTPNPDRLSPKSDR
ncbi:hypothetical protein GT204_26010 [Streptomyces sp. SID4919]|nr:hypothetical protein [Streptomyces sp. SID4919]